MVGINAWLRTTEYHPARQTPGNMCTVTFAGGAFRNSTLRPDHESRPPVGPPLHAREPLGPPPLFRSDPHVDDHPGLANPTLHRRHHRRPPNSSIASPDASSSGAQRPATDLMTVREVLAELNGVSRDTFYRWRQLGVAPPAIRLPNGELRIRRAEFLRWLDNLPSAA